MIRPRSLPLFLVLLFALGAAACVPSGRGTHGAVAPSGFAGQYAVALPEFATPVTRGEITTAFAEYGSVAIVRKLHTGNAANWNMIMNKVAAGDAAWIRCAAEYILPGADGAAAEDIIISLAYGLQGNPTAVLAALGDDAGVSIESVCSLPFIEPDQGFLETYGERTLAALRKVGKRDLVLPRNECMHFLQDSLVRAAAEEYAAGKS